MVTDLLGNEDKEIVLAEKIMHRGSLYGMLQSGGKFPLEQLFGIKIHNGGQLLLLYCWDYSGFFKTRLETFFGSQKSR